LEESLEESGIGLKEEVEKDSLEAENFKKDNEISNNNLEDNFFKFVKILKKLKTILKGILLSNTCSLCEKELLISYQEKLNNIFFKMKKIFFDTIKDSFFMKNKIANFAIKKKESILSSFNAISISADSENVNL